MDPQMETVNTIYRFLSHKNKYRFSYCIFLFLSLGEHWFINQLF